MWGTGSLKQKWDEWAEFEQKDILDTVVPFPEAALWGLVGSISPSDTRNVGQSLGKLSGWWQGWVVILLSGLEAPGTSFLQLAGATSINT